MLITINDHIQLDSSFGFRYEQGEMYGASIYYGDSERDEVVIVEETANSTDDDCRPATERPLDTLHRRSGSGWKYCKVSSSPCAEMMTKASCMQILTFSVKMIGVSLCIETGKDSILLLHAPVAINNENYDDYFSICKVLIQIGKALVIDGQYLTFTTTDIEAIAKMILPEFGPPTKTHVSVVPKIKT